MSMIAETPELSNLSNDEFETYVNRDVRGDLPASLAALLRRPENAERWYNTLLKMKRTVEGQFASDRAERSLKQAEYLSKGSVGKIDWLAYRAEADKWRANATRFLNGVESKLMEAAIVRSQARARNHAGFLIQERDRARNYAGTLRTAILHHRDHVNQENTDDAEDYADEKLWSLVDEDPAI